jgi:hypothetical protein
MVRCGEPVDRHRERRGGIRQVAFIVLNLRRPSMLSTAGQVLPCARTLRGLPSDFLPEREHFGAGVEAIAVDRVPSSGEFALVVPPSKRRLAYPEKPSGFFDRDGLLCIVISVTHVTYVNEP